MGIFLEISIARRRCLCVSGRWVYGRKTLTVEFGSQSRISTLESIYIVRPVVNGKLRKATGGLLETTGNHRGQFPRTVSFAGDTESSLLPTLPGPLKLPLTWETNLYVHSTYLWFYIYINIYIYIYSFRGPYGLTSFVLDFQADC